MLNFGSACVCGEPCESGSLDEGDRGRERERERERERWEEINNEKEREAAIFRHVSNHCT